LGYQLVNAFRGERQMKLVGLYVSFVTNVPDVVSQFYINSTTTKRG